MGHFSYPRGLVAGDALEEADERANFGVDVEANSLANPSSPRCSSWSGVARPAQMLSFRPLNYHSIDSMIAARSLAARSSDSSASRNHGTR